MRRLLQPCLAQIGEPALWQSRILVLIDLPPRSERVMRAKPENFRSLCPRIVIAPQLNIDDGQPHGNSGIVGLGHVYLFEYGARFFKAPRTHIGASYLD